MNSNYAPTAPAAQGALRVLPGSTFLQNELVRVMCPPNQTLLFSLDVFLFLLP